ncbi:MAG: FHA domain-containing protein [Paracoccaceae bacterium]|nr:FHA domain-containing protein [Paracoccaceae bacterium]
MSEAAAQAARAALRPEVPASDRPESGAPSAATVSDALARHGDETFAARARLAAQQAGLPRRPRIWEMDESGGAGTTRPASARAESRGGRGDWLDRIGTPGEGAGEGGTAALRMGQSDEADPGARLPGSTPGSRDGAGGADRSTTDAAMQASRRPAPFVLGRRPDPAASAGVPAADGAGARPKDIADEPADAPEGDADDPVVYARAQLARMAELGLADEGLDDAESTPHGGRSARVKTRVLGFRPPEADDDPLARDSATGAGRGPDFPVGWLVVVGGAGRGASFALTSGVATLGRGEDQTVRLDFGDTAISRQGHASIVFDDETGRFFLGAGSRTNLVRRNGRPVLATEEVAGGDEIRLGETTLRLVALCGDGFSWSDGAADGGAAGGA